ncbi:DUF4124 domain-containing protein [Geomonas sp.]|uniref:DUF4124 domain-containing protein n=1 Tax=Geomonas sp. TaxID=2651584 RepID=UPI002B46E262|nr:DUF4124 domain-containing protein [Geomonas sp.]HJV34931.1 DUF4124 domain-containing protein [Geomonas sp.]
MKRSFPFLLAMILLIHSAAYAAFFKWVDESGVTHFTDSRNKIPKKYRKQAKELTMLEDSSPAHPTQEAAPTPVQQPAAQQPPANQEPTYGGHNAPWWKDQFSKLKAQVKDLQASLAQKNAKLAELRRKRALYFRAQDRVAINEMQDSIAADESKLSDTLKQLDDLDQQATREGVPADWR